MKPIKKFLLATAACVLVLVFIAAALIGWIRYSNLQQAAQNAFARDEARLARLDNCRTLFEGFDGGMAVEEWIDGLLDEGFPLRKGQFERSAEYAARIDSVASSYRDPQFITYGTIDPANYDPESSMLRIPPLRTKGGGHRFAYYMDDNGPYDSFFEDYSFEDTAFMFRLRNTNFITSSPESAKGFIPVNIRSEFRNSRDRILPGQFRFQLDRDRMREIYDDLRFAIYVEPVYPYLIVRETAASRLTPSDTEDHRQFAGLFTFGCIAVVYGEEVLAVSTVEAM